MNQPIKIIPTFLLDKRYTTRQFLASTENLKGASLVGIEDAAGKYIDTDVEGALTEIANGDVNFPIVRTPQIKTDTTTPTDLTITTGAAKTLVLNTPVWDDLRVTPAGFDRAGIADPALVSYTPTGSSIATYLYEWQVDDIAYFTVQLPHSYKVGTDIAVHVHWTPGLRGNEESGNKVGWKVDYTWANIDGTFGAMGTADLSDACDGTDDKHQMTPDVTIDGHTAAKGISSMLICNIKRTDTGTDDTWVGTASGQLPLILEIDFHFSCDTLGSRAIGTK